MLRRAAATASNGALRRPVTSTRAPFWAKASAAERPMPELPPVIMTTWFSYGLIVPPRRSFTLAAASDRWTCARSPKCRGPRMTDRHRPEFQFFDHADRGSGNASTSLV